MIAMIVAALVTTLLGQAVPEWPAKPPDRWIQGGPLTLGELHGKVVLIRFFTDADCPYCRATAPALNEFNDAFSGSGLVVVGMYTPKPRPRPVSPNAVRDLVEAYGFRFPVALDTDWGALNTLWLDRVPGAQFTSASLLIDRRGILRHVQEGGAYAKDSADPQARRDYQKIREAIVKLLAEPAP